MKYLPIGDALTIKLTEPIWTLLIAKVKQILISNFSINFYGILDFSEDSHGTVETCFFRQCVCWNSFMCTATIHLRSF